MCDVKRKDVLASLGSAALGGAAKASPGAIVGSGIVDSLGIQLNHVVSELTIVYICVMIIGALPKVWHSLMFLWSKVHSDSKDERHD